jgi:hypothetical protein
MMVILETVYRYRYHALKKTIKIVFIWQIIKPIEVWQVSIQ